MLELIKNVFGNAITEEEYSFPPGTPMYIRHGYNVKRVCFHGKDGLLVQPKGDDKNLSALKKHAVSIEKICRESVILGLDRMTALQRRNLIEAGIAFVCGQGQIFIPFWGSYFEDRILNPPEPVSAMTANAQLVFLYIYYHQSTDSSPMNQTQIAGALHLPKSTCTRAVQLLQGLGLIAVSEQGTANLISLSDDKSVCLKNAIPFMCSPVQRRIYVKNIPSGIKYKISGLKALSQMSMISPRKHDAGYAVSKDTEKLIDRELILDESTFRDFGGEVIEVWKYDPFLLSESECVDEISLLMILNGEADERIQKELDSIRQKNGLSGSGA